MKCIDKNSFALYILIIIIALGITLFIGACVDYGPTSHAYNIPEITLLGNAIDTVPAGVKYIDSGAVATDVEDGNLTGKLEINYGTLDTANPVVGTYTITYSVTDSKGIKVSLNRIIVVANFPVITLLGKVIDTVPRRIKYVESGATAVDVEDGDLTNMIIVNYDTLFNLLNPVMGTYAITYIVVDSDGHTSIEARTVVVLNLPVITLLGKKVDTVQAGIQYVDSEATAFDLDDGDLTGEIKIDYGDLDTANPVEGTYSIIYSVMNSDGKTNSVNRTVVVLTSIQQDTTKIVDLQNTNSLFDDTNTVYLITQNLTVPDGYCVTFGMRTIIIVESPIVINGTFAIEGGSRLLMVEGAYLAVGTGALSIKGTATDTVCIINYASDKYWGYDGNNSDDSYALLFSSNSMATSSINFCTIDSGTTGINVQKDGIAITNSTIKHSKYAGIHFYDCGPKDSATFVNNSFIGNGITTSFFPLEINTKYLPRLSGTATFTDNFVQAILVKSGTAENTGTWRKHIIPYVFEKGTVISNTNGVTITIEPGTKLQFKKDAYLTVDAAKLIASATTANPITFSNFKSGEHWGYDAGNSKNSYGINFTANANANSVMNYCLIDSGTAGINVKKDGITISNTTVQNCQYAGMYFSNCGPKDSLTFINNSFTDNGSTNSFYPLHLSAAYLHRLSGSLLFTDNSNNAILVDSATVTVSGSWKKQTVPYVFNTGQAVIDNANGVQITINPGAVLKFLTSSMLLVDNGTFIANGTASETITFTSWVQGQYWGADAGAGYDSYGILFTDKTNANSSISYCSFSNATQAINSRNSPVTVSNISITDCKYYGLYSKGTGNANINNVSITFSGNGSGDYLHED